MKTILLSILTSLAGMSLVLTSCGGKEERREAKMNKGFRLPEGDAERGKATFVQLKCHQCHSVNGVELPPAEGTAGVSFALGGEVTKVKSYGELVTAIIQPQHVVSPDYLAMVKIAVSKGDTSPMPEYNETMTVRQMSDLVAFLHGHYKKHVPSFDEEMYRYY
jgi:sulfur-oxidizing protein SoxX